MKSFRLLQERGKSKITYRALAAWGFGAGLAFMLCNGMCFFMEMKSFYAKKGHECYQ